MAENILKSGSVSLSERPLMGLVYTGGVPGIDGKHYGRTGFLEPVLAMAMYAVGSALDRFLPGDISIGAIFFVLALCPIFGGLCGMLIYLISVNWYRPRTAITVALIYSLGTMAFPYSNLRSETVLVFCLLLMFYGIIKCGVGFSAEADSGNIRGALIAGAGAGAAIATKSYAVLLVIPGLLLFILSVCGKKQWGKFAAFFAFVAIFSILEAGYNELRFGSTFSTGYPATFGFDLRHLGLCLYVLFASPAKSVFMFCPVLLTAILAVRSFNSAHSLWFKFILIETLLLILFISTFREPLLFADEVWGSRYLFPVVSFWTLVAGAWVDRGSKRAISVYLFGGMGFLVSLPGVLIRPETIFSYSQRICESPMYCRLLDSTMNAIIFNTRMLFGLGPGFLEPMSHLWLWWVQILRPEFLTSARVNALAMAATPTIRILAVVSAGLLVLGAISSGISLARSCRNDTMKIS